VEHQPYIALTGALPALLAMWYYDRLDAKRPEPRATRRKVAVAGALSVVPVGIVSLVLMQLGPAVGTVERALYDSFVVAAGVEELFKILVVYWVVWRLPEFDERMDGIVYAARAGLGFALVENVLYLMQAEDLASFALTYVLRAALAVPGHAMWAAMIGYFAARQRFDGTGPGIIGGWAIAVALHGIYDAAVFLQPPFRAAGWDQAANALLTVPVLVILFGGLALRGMARRAVAADDLAELRRGWRGPGDRAA
jgi:RsiW-degrading membrane proteinase PrsW (M82 family)